MPIDLLDSISHIEEYLKKGDYNQEQLIFDAIIRRLQTLSESTSKLPNTIKNSFPDIEWQKIKSFRNYITHEYFEENMSKKIITDIITNDIPKLKIAITKILKYFPDENI